MRRREKGREGRLMQGHDCGERTDTMTNAEARARVIDRTSGGR